MAWLSPRPTTRWRSGTTTAFGAGSSGSTVVQTGATTGASAANGDPLSDVHTLVIPGNQAPGAYYGNLAYSVFSN